MEASLIRLRSSTFDASVSVVGSATVLRAARLRTTLVLNRAIGLGMGEQAGREALEEIDNIYRAKQLTYAIELSPFAAPPALRSWIRARRMRRTIGTAMLYRHAAPIPRPSSAVSVEHADATSRRVIADVCASVFRVPGPVSLAIAALADNPDWRQWVAFLDGEPVGAALSFVAGDAAWLGWTAVLPSARGRGVQLALITEHLNHAYRSGCSYVTCETAPDTAAGTGTSFRNFARLGFSFAYERATFVSVYQP